jgi:hypothetical protein
LPETDAAQARTVAERIVQVVPKASAKLAAE